MAGLSDLEVAGGLTRSGDHRLFVGHVAYLSYWEYLPVEHPAVGSFEVFLSVRLKDHPVHRGSSAAFRRHHIVGVAIWSDNGNGLRGTQSPDYRDQGSLLRAQGFREHYGDFYGAHERFVIRLASVRWHHVRSKRKLYGPIHGSRCRKLPWFRALPALGPS